MRCRIADLLVQIPPQGDLPARCKAYLSEGDAPADIVIDPACFQAETMERLGDVGGPYMESGRIFYWELPGFGGLMLHASALEYAGRAYLFSGPSTVGKSTHTRLWRELLGEDVKPINDDKPALRCIDGVWYAYGTPWCGKDGINRNVKAPVAGICFLKQGTENSIRKLEPTEAISHILSQCVRKGPAHCMAKMLTLVDALVRQIPIYELTNMPTLEAAELSAGAMGAIHPVKS